MSTLHAFLDESDAQPDGLRTGTYLMAAALIEQAELDRVNTLLRALVRPEDDHARLHFSRIVDRTRKKELAAMLGALRGTRFLVGWAGGYTHPKDRERVRQVVLKHLLLYLAKDCGAARIFIEQREDRKLRASDSRVASQVKDHDPIVRDVDIRQVRASDQPGLWLADTAAAAWRRHLVERQQNWSSWYSAHTELIEITWPPV